MLFILCTLLLALKRLWQALESWHLKVGDRFFWVLLHELFAFNWKMMNKKSTKDVKSCGRHPTKKKKKINNKATNKHKQDNRTTYVYKKWLPPIIPHSDTFLSEVHSYHTFCTHIYNPNVHFTSKINIFTQKRKTIWINNFIDKKKKTSTPKFKHSERNKTQSSTNSISWCCYLLSSHSALNSVQMQLIYILAEVKCMLGS